MRRSISLAVAILLVTLANGLQAQNASKPEALTALAKTPSIQAVNKLPHAIIYPGDVYYSGALANNGVQGSVTLEVRLSKTGAASATKIINSSKSVELDKNALDFVNDEKWKLPDNGLKYFEGIYFLNIIFRKDSVLTINNKTCADFNIDLAYFRNTQPDESTKNLAAFELIAGIFSVQLVKTQSADVTLKFVKSVDAINGDTILACKKKPDELFVKNYVNASKHHGIKF